MSKVGGRIGAGPDRLGAPEIADQPKSSQAKKPRESITDSIFELYTQNFSPDDFFETADGGSKASPEENYFQNIPPANGEPTATFHFK